MINRGIVGYCYVVALMILGVSCNSSPKVEGTSTNSVPEGNAELPPDRTELLKEIRDIGKTAETSISLLKELSEEQQQAVFNLVVAVEALTTVGARGSKIEKTAASDLLVGSLKALPQAVNFTRPSFLACFDESLAYAGAMARCDGKDESDCPAAWGLAHALGKCQIAELAKVPRTVPIRPGGGTLPPM